jgi:hypothetical protein
MRAYAVTVTVSLDGAIELVGAPALPLGHHPAVLVVSTSSVGLKVTGMAELADQPKLMHA